MMYKLLVAICVVTNFDGVPVNSCYLLEDKKIYTDIDYCAEAALERELQVMKKYNENTGSGNIVVQALCVKNSGA